MSDDEAGTKDISRTVRVGLALTGSADAIRHIVEFVASIVLARLLRPEDFGTIAVVTSFLQISYVVGNFGMGGAIVQAKDVARNDIRTALSLSTGVGLILTIAGIAATPAITRFFNIELLSVIMPIMSFQVLLAGYSAIPIALLRRSLSFGKLAVVEGGGAIVFAVVGLTLANTGYGIWSLVWAPMASNIWVLGCSSVLAKFTPGFSWNRDSIKKLLGFGSGLTLKNLFVYSGRNLDNLIVAKLLGSGATGFYNRAFNLTRMPQTRLVGVIYRVCFPAFCKLRDDRERFHSWYVKATTVVSVVVAPVLMGLCVVSDDFVLLVLGEHWRPMISPLRILCFSAMINCLHMLGGAAIEATGKIRYEVATEMMYAVLVIAGCIVGSQFGIRGAAAAILLAAIAIYCAKAFTVRDAVGLSIRRYIGATLPALGAGLIMIAAVLLMRRTFFDAAAVADGSWSRLLFSIVVGAVAYPIALRLIARPQADMVLEQVRQILNRKRGGSNGDSSADSTPVRV